MRKLTYGYDQMRITAKNICTCIIKLTKKI